MVAPCWGFCLPEPIGPGPPEPPLFFLPYQEPSTTVGTASTLGKSVVKVQVTFANGAIPPGAANSNCTYSLYNRDTLERIDSQPAALLKEGAGLVFYVESQSAHDLIKVDLETTVGVTWQSAYHGLHVAPVQMEQNGLQD